MCITSLLWRSRQRRRWVSSSHLLSRSMSPCRGGGNPLTIKKVVTSIVPQEEILIKLHAQMKAKGLTAKVSASDKHAYWEATGSYNYLQDSTKAMIDLVSTHAYSKESGEQGWLRDAVKGSKPIWMNEYGDWDHTGWEMAKVISSNIKDLKAESWTYWQVADAAWGWGLMRFYGEGTFGKPDSYTYKIGEIHRKWWALAHYSRFIRPGMKIIDVGDQYTVGAYDDAAKTLTLVTLNTKGDYYFGYSMDAFESAAGPVKRYTSQFNEDDASTTDLFKQSDMTITCKRLDAKVAANALETFVIENVVMGSTSSPTAAPATTERASTTADAPIGQNYLEVDDMCKFRMNGYIEVGSGDSIVSHLVTDVQEGGSPRRLSDEPRRLAATPGRILLMNSLTAAVPSNTQVAATATSPPSPSCFAGDTQVFVQADGWYRAKQMALQKVGLGQRVLAATAGGQTEYSEVIGFLHASSGEGKHLTIEHSDGEVRMSSNHLVFVKLASGAVEERTAGQVRPGDALLVGGQGTASRVFAVRGDASRSGLWAPLTTSGTIIADGVAASNYASIADIYIPHSAMHVAFFLARVLRFTGLVVAWMPSEQHGMWSKATSILLATRAWSI
eukprot:TRINITY_DN82576_c0_g1_i1.p1 TRINITY_DN82576_c0_g1~~TRINITY_DN82576_c0_g1_i1.p1  ORF type:complete len:614 (+),score=85.59 TRINITY_DN82576_c0_g1_i1:710-2551(+)